MSLGFKIENYHVYGLDDALRAAAYSHDVDADPFRPVVPHDFERARRLGISAANSGHNSFAKGILVNIDITFPLYWLKEAERYHFFDVVTSQSSRYSATKWKVADRCTEQTDPRIAAICQEYADAYNEECGKDTTGYTEEQLAEHIKKLDKINLEIQSNLPGGLCMTACFTTNYLELKTIYKQRHDHPFPDWQIFCAWILTLPHFKEFFMRDNGKII